MRLHVETAGAAGADAVLFLHGVTGSAATYRWLEPDGYRAVRLDFRGHGASQRAPGGYRLEDYMDDAVSVLEDLGRAAVVGHSLGGVVAWTVAQRRPDLVARAFLEDPPLYMGEPAEHERNGAIPIFREAQAAVARWQAEGADEATVRAQLPFADVQEPDALAARAYALLRIDPEVYERILDGSLLTATDTRSPVAVPVFVLASDPAFSAFPPDHEARLAGTHPAVEVERVAGAGHSIHDERAHRPTYAARVAAFLGRA